MIISAYKDRKLSPLDKIFSKKFSLFSYIDKNRFFLLFILIPHVLIVICYRKEIPVRNQQKTILEFGKIKQRIARTNRRKNFLKSRFIFFFLCFSFSSPNLTDFFLFFVKIISVFRSIFADFLA